MDASEVSIRGIIKSAVTDSVQSNASFASASGLRAKIIRTAGANACEECVNLAGSWYYGSEPKKVYWRHGGCTCTVTYDPGTGKTQNVHTKAWSDSNTAEIENRKTASAEIIRHIPRSLGAAGKHYPVKLLDSNQHTKLAEGQEISGKVFAGQGTETIIKDVNRLVETYHIKADLWKKVSGEGYIILNGKQVKAELHWYEADNEVYEMKVKRYIDES